MTVKPDGAILGKVPVKYHCLEAIVLRLWDPTGSISDLGGSCRWSDLTAAPFKRKPWASSTEVQKRLFRICPKQSQNAFNDYVTN
jgi:hypothetical protein